MRLFVIKQFEKRIDALHKLPPDLGACPFNQVHCHPAGSPINHAHFGGFDRRDFIRSKDSYAVNQRACGLPPFDQLELTPHLSIPVHKKEMALSPEKAVLLSPIECYRPGCITLGQLQTVDLTPFVFISTIPVAMGTKQPNALLVLATLVVTATGCGLAYDASTHVRASRMVRSLKPGESSLAVHQHWGEPDIRQYIGRDREVWSYAIQPNSNDVAATLLYTSIKPGNDGSFLDLKFTDGKLVSWNRAEHTVPAKQGAGFSFGVGPGGAVSNLAHF